MTTTLPFLPVLTSHFPRYPLASIPSHVVRDWTDDSYRHDVCPSFTFGRFRLFVDHPDPAQREEPHSKRFSLTTNDDLGVYTEGAVAAEAEEFAAIISALPSTCSLAFREAGFHAYDSGGGCTVLRRVNGDHTETWVTLFEESRSPDQLCQPITVGHYLLDADGNELDDGTYTDVASAEQYLTHTLGVDLVALTARILAGEV